jgi:hypothetical protein
MRELNPFLVGTGQIDQTRLVLPHATRDRYSDAQLDDYAQLRSRSFPHRPPFRITLRARFSSTNILGTAGFGLWNHPFAPNGRVPTLPRALWFFYASPPSDMQLALDVPGCGWKAAVIDATRPSAVAMVPLAPIVLLLNRSKRLYRRWWPVVQHSLCIAEWALPLDLMPAWHTYSIEWEIDRARLSVDNQIVLETSRPPVGAMGFVAWIDNQCAVVTPTGKVQFGLLDIPHLQWLDIEMQ